MENPFKKKNYWYMILFGLTRKVSNYLKSDKAKLVIYTWIMNNVHVDNITPLVFKTLRLKIYIFCFSWKSYQKKYIIN